MDPPRKKNKIIRIDNFLKSSSAVESRPTTNSSLPSSQETPSAQAVVEDATVDSCLLTEKPYQPCDSFSFPKTSFGNQQRSCQAHWFKEFSWLDYDERKDIVTCFICKRHKNKLQSERNKEDTFLKTRFSKLEESVRCFQRPPKIEVPHCRVDL